ncbi:MAG: SpoIIE family protein phosphatase [Flavobacteriales bacterium]|nr:SpoIIE family protein phosphatase [Flavobacteriales bacterium]
MRYTFSIFLLFLVIGVASQSFKIESEVQKAYLSKYAEIYEDAESKYTIEHVLNKKASFEIVKEEIPYLDFTTSTFWLKFSIVNESDDKQNLLLETARPLTNVVNLYEVSWADRSVKSVQKNGDELPFAERPFAHQNMVFPISLEAGETKEYVLQLKSDGETLSAPITLWDYPTFSKADGNNRLFSGAYYGMLVFISIIFFFFFLALKLRSFLYYVLYVVNLLFFQLSIDGFAYQYLWPESPWMGNHSILLFVCSTAFVLLTYGKEFLQVKIHSKALYRLSNVLLVLISLCFIASFGSGKIYAFCFPFVNLMSFAAMMVIIISVIILIRKKVNISIFFLMAFVALIVGAALFVLGNVNVVKHNVITEYGIKFGSALEVIFLSIAMAGKYQEIQKEKESAQEQSLKRLQEMNQLKDEINVRLEKQVAERTEEIREQKKELEEYNKEITDSIHYAQRIQYAILPAEEQFRRLLPESFVLFKPKDIVSGDFYWVAERGNMVYYLAGDCTGHGVPGAFMSLINTILLGEAMSEKIQLPGDILKKVRLGIVDTLKQKGGSLSQKDGMDAALCAIDYKNKMLYFSGANNPLYLVREKEKIEVMIRGEILEPSIENETHKLYQIAGDKKPVGYSDHDPEFTTRSFKLEFGDTLYTFSDGFADQFGGAKGKKMKYKRLREIIISMQNTRLSEQKDVLDEAFEDWKGANAQVDDVCIIGVRV